MTTHTTPSPATEIARPVIAVNKYVPFYVASTVELIGMIRRGLASETLVTTRIDMGISKERLFTILRFPRSTTNRQIANRGRLSSEYSERMLGLLKLIGQVEQLAAESGIDSGFSPAKWVGSWLERPLPALGNAKPADFMDTMVGQSVVASLVARMQSGAYA